MHIRLLAVAALVGLLAGCGGSAPGIDVDAIDRVVLTDGESVTVTVVDKKVIGLLAAAVDDAVVEEGKLAVRKLRSVDFQSGGKSLVKLQFYGVLFDIGDKQYIDETNTINAIAGGMLDAKAPLYGEVDCEKTLPADSRISLKYTVTNAGETSVTIAAAFRAHIRFLRLLKDEAKPDTEVLSVPAGKVGYLDVEGKEPVILAPGASHVYTLAFHTGRIGAGDRALSIQFAHLAETPPADEVVPPSIAGIQLTFH